MRQAPYAHPLLAILLLAILVLTAGTSLAEPKGIPLDDNGQEKSNAGWTLHIDNDLLVPGRRDQDYTGGLGVTFAGRQAKERWWSLDPLIEWLDNGLRLREKSTADTYRLHAQQIGLIVFSPSDIGEADINYADRPFANLVYVSNSRRYITTADAPVHQSTLTLGLLGTRVGPEIQKGIHKLTDSNTPSGWDHQISEGGEPTFQYSLSRQSLLTSNFQEAATEYEVKYNLAASVGYITETSIALSGRWGIINTPWWSFTPENVDYASQPAPVIGDSVREGVTELFLWGGVKLRARAYNAFLQGQFRDSDVTFASDEIRHLLAEGWLGLTQEIRNYRLSYVVRYQSKEIKSGAGARAPVWGGLIFSADY